MKKRRHPSPRRRPAARAAERAADPEGFAARALGYEAVVADASSLIVLADIGALAAARRSWRLLTIAAAAAEAGATGEGLELLESGADGGDLSTDRALVVAARRSRLPLLSEDRKVLMDGEDHGLDCLDALVALELFAATGALSPADYDQARTSLLERNSYTPSRLGWAAAVGAAAAKLA